MIYNEVLTHVQVHFAVQSDHDASLSRDHERIIIRAEHKETYFQLIPQEILKAHLPALLIEGHIHWLNLSTFNIEIRPVKEPWKQSSDNWSIDFRPGRSRITKGSESLVDKQSLTWAMLSGRLRCLDDPENFIITTSPVDIAQSLSPLQLSVNLPRYGLSFFVNNADDLESLEFRNMVYDEDQCIGTLFGLVNRLVLRPKTQIEEELIPKRIIIPHSDSLNSHGHNIYVKLPFLGPIRHYTYQMDSELGCLKGFVDLESRLYLAHLHSLTSSGCRPDPLTGRTGVEEAMSLIWLAGTRQATSMGNRASDFKSQSCQMHFAFAEIQEPAHDRPGSLAEDILLREARLFPSEVVVNLLPSRKEPLKSIQQLFHERPPPTCVRVDRLPCYEPRQHGHSAPNSLPQLFSTLRSNPSAPAIKF